MSLIGAGLGLGLLRFRSPNLRLAWVGVRWAGICVFYRWLLSASVRQVSMLSPPVQLLQVGLQLFLFQTPSWGGLREEVWTRTQGLVPDLL